MNDVPLHRPVLFCCCVALLSAGAFAATPSAIAIRHAHVVTVSGAEMSSGTVVLRDGLIESVGSDENVPPDAWVIDGSGLTVYPGFIDGLSTWGIPQATPAPQRTPAVPAAPPPQAAGPRPRGPEDRPQTFAADRAADMIRPDDARLGEVRAAGFTTAITYPSRGIFAGQGAAIDLAGERAGSMVVAQPTGQYIILRTAGFRAGFPNSLMGVLAYVRQLYMDADQYEQARRIYAEHATGTRRPEYDHALEGLLASPRVLLPANQAQQIDRMIKFAAELHRPAVLYGLQEGFRRVDALKEAKLPLLVNLKWPERPRNADPADIPNLRDLELRDQAPTLPAMLAKAGVRFAFYSDGLATAAELRRNMRRAVELGLPPADAIRALTLNAAEMYGLNDRLGSIDKGKIANLTVTRGDFWAEKATVEYVFVDGVMFEPGKELRTPPARAEPEPAPPTDETEQKEDDR